MDELIETEALEKKQVTLREYLDGLEMVSIKVEAEDFNAQGTTTCPSMRALLVGRYLFFRQRRNML